MFRRFGATVSILRVTDLIQMDAEVVRRRRQMRGVKSVWVVTRTKETDEGCQSVWVVTRTKAETGDSAVPSQWRLQFPRKALLRASP